MVFYEHADSRVLVDEGLNPVCDDSCIDTTGKKVARRVESDRYTGEIGMSEWFGGIRWDCLDELLAPSFSFVATCHGHMV